jgi:predicted ester cyclase
MGDGANLEAFYRGYLKRCSECRFGELGQFVGEDVEVNGMVRGLRCMSTGRLSRRGVPGLSLGLAAPAGRRLLAGRAPGPHGHDPGRPVSIREFAMYRVAGGRIVEAWGDLDRDRLADSSRT